MILREKWSAILENENENGKWNLEMEMEMEMRKWKYEMEMKVKMRKWKWSLILESGNGNGNGTRNCETMKMITFKKVNISENHVKTLGKQKEFLSENLGKTKGNRWDRKKAWIQIHVFFLKSYKTMEIHGFPRSKNLGKTNKNGTENLGIQEMLKFRFMYFLESRYSGGNGKWIVEPW